jgi:hypothetical protein
MPKIDIKSLLIGIALGYLVLPRVAGFVTGKVADLKGDDK